MTPSAARPIVGRALVGALFVLLAWALVACGGRARSAQGEAAEGSGPTCAACFSERWEVPPMGIGATPPENTAPIEAIEAFEDPSGTASGSATDGSGT